MIFLDTSFIYALADRRDRYHEAARRRFALALASGRRIVTHSYVISESVALLERRLGRRVALDFARDAARFEI